MVRLATIGTSGITEKFISACRAAERYELIASYSRDAARGAAFAEKHGFKKSCSDLKALANDPDIDAVYIASPNVFHYSQSRLLLESGKHIICEKPIVTESRLYAELLELAEKNGLIYAEAIMSRHSEGRKILHSALAEIGKIYQARFDFCQRSSRYDRFMSGEHMNIFDMSLGAGTLMDLGVYCVWAAVDLFGMPDNISAFASFFENGADCSGSAIFEYGNFSASLTYSKAGNTAAGSEIIGDKGTVKIGSVSQYTNISLVQNGNERILYSNPEHSSVMAGEARKFADYIEKPKLCRSDYENVCKSTLEVHKCMDLIKNYAKINYPLKECRL